MHKLYICKLRNYFPQKLNVFFLNYSILLAFNYQPRLLLIYDEATFLHEKATAVLVVAHW